MTSNVFPIMAVDLGNHRLKFGRFDAADATHLPEPCDSMQLDHVDTELDRLGAWLEETHPGALSWWIGSVNRPAMTRLIDWLRDVRPSDRVTLVSVDDLPLEVAVSHPDRVGIDRLLDAVASNRIKRPDRPAIVIDVGTAITVDLLSAEGVFEGGSILPGIGMSARALHEFTDLLPRLEMSELHQPPPVLGTTTDSAIRSGLFWGAIGAIRELVLRLSNDFVAEPDIFLTGGTGPAVATWFGPSARHVPHLTLAGIALTVVERLSPSDPSRRTVG